MLKWYQRNEVNKLQDTEKFSQQKTCIIQQVTGDKKE